MDFTSTIVRPNSSGPITDNIQSIVSTNVGGIKEIVPSEHGQLVPSEDLEALVSVIKEQLIRLDEYDSIEMHQKATEKFSYHTIGIRLGEIYESIIMKHV